VNRLVYFTALDGHQFLIRPDQVVVVLPVEARISRENKSKVKATSLVLPYGVFLCKENLDEVKRILEQPDFG
jgi:hypothetical protein